MNGDALRRVLTLSAAVLALCCAGVSTALAAGPIGVSPDGHTWTSRLSTPVFDPAVRWVPGDVRTGRFYVRNQASDTGVLSLGAEALDPEGLVRNGDIALEVRRDGGAWAPLRADGRTHPLATRPLGSGATTRIDVRAVFVPSSQNPSQAESVRLDFTIGLAEASTVASPHHGALPGTGGPSFWFLVLGLALVCVGLSVVTFICAGGRRSAAREVHHV